MSYTVSSREILIYVESASISLSHRNSFVSRMSVNALQTTRHVIYGQICQFVVFFFGAMHILTIHYKQIHCVYIYVYKPKRHKFRKQKHTKY